MKNRTSKLLALLLTLAMVLPMALPALQAAATEATTEATTETTEATTEAATEATEASDATEPEETTPSSNATVAMTTVYDFSDESQLANFSLYQSATGSFVAQDGRLIPTVDDGEIKAIYKHDGALFHSVSVDIYPGADGINSGIYLNVGEVGHERDQIDTVCVIVQSDFTGWTDAPNRTDIIVGTFPTWKEYHRVISETGSGNNLFTGGNKEPLNLKVDINGNVLSICVSLLSDPSKRITTTYTYSGVEDTLWGDVGIRSNFNLASYDNFTVSYTEGAVAFVGGSFYETVAEAVAGANGDIVKLLANSNEDISISDNVILDLNGYDLTGNFSGKGTLYGMDSANDTYNESKCGRITGTVTCSVAHLLEGAEDSIGKANDYIAIVDDSGYTFHRYYVGITHVSLHPDMVALGYKATFAADATVLSYVENFGYQLGIDPNNMKHFYKAGAFENGQVLTLRLKNILSDGNDSLNQIGATAQIYGSAFATVNLGDQQIVLSSSLHETSLQRVLETVNTNWNSIAYSRKSAVKGMIDRYPDYMTQWNINNIWAFNTEVDALKILTVGNSFSVDSMEYFYQIAQDVGVENIVLGDLYIGACSLDTHLANLRSGNAAYTYYQNYTGTWTTVEKHTMQAAIESEDWDYICFQHSNVGWDSNSYASLNDLIDGIAELCPNAKFVWNMYWAYPNDSDHHAFPNYGGTQESMYNMILERTQDLIITNEKISIVIPAGTAIQNARSSFLGDTLNRDNCHLNDIGKYIAGITWVEAITGIDTSNLQYRPAIITEDIMAVAIESVHNAMAKPYEVTPSQYIRPSKYLVVKGDASVVSYDSEVDVIHINMANSATRNQVQLFDENGNVVGGNCFAVTGHVKMDNTAVSGSAASKIEFQFASDSDWVKFLVYRYEAGSSMNNSINLLLSDTGNGKTASGFVKDNCDGTFSIVTSGPNNLTAGVPYEADYLMIYENGTVYFVLEGKLMYRYEGAFDAMQYYFGVTQYADVTYTNTKVVYDADEVASLADPYRPVKSRYNVTIGDESVMSYDSKTDVITIDMDKSATRNQAQLLDDEGNVVGGECFAVTGRVKMDNTATSGSAASKIEFQVASGNQYVKFLIYRYEVGSQKNNSINLLLSDPGNNKTASGFIKDNGDGTFSTVTTWTNNMSSGVPYETDYMMIYENGTVYFVLEGKLMYRYAGAFDDLQYYFGVTQYADVTYINTEVTYDAEEVAALAEPFRV